MEQRKPTRGDKTRSCRPIACRWESRSRGFSGRIHAIHVREATNGLPAIELERRLLELGFIEGADVTVLHEGPVGRDPLAVRVNGATIALRRREAMAIFVIPPGGPA